MDKKKIIKIVLIGMAVAALVCIVTGVCIYVPAVRSVPLRSDPDYTALLSAKIHGIQMGMFILIVGCSFFILSFLGFLAALVDGRGLF